MSSDDYRSNTRYTLSNYAETDDAELRKALMDKHHEEVAAARTNVRTNEGRIRQRATIPDDADAVQRTITDPPAEAEELHVVLIDNSGSNELVARRMRQISSYLLVNLRIIAPKHATVFAYFSDHTDGDLFWQAINWVMPTDRGELVLTSTLKRTSAASGHDRAEAYECAILQACQLPFGNILRDKRHLYVIGDEVAHGMGETEDHGCPKQVNWVESVEKAKRVFGTFVVIGSGDSPKIADLQRQFIETFDAKREALDFISLVTVENINYRLGLIPNAWLFAVARQQGLQTLEGFLSRLFLKWLEEPIFGNQTYEKAKEAIARFAKYIETDKDDLIRMLTRILSVTKEEATALIEQGAKLL